MIQKPKNNSKNGDTMVPHVQIRDVEAIKQDVSICLLGQRWNYLVDYQKWVQPSLQITMLHSSTDLGSNLSPNIEANF
jgi:hypothetical protein